MAPEPQPAAAVDSSRPEAPSLRILDGDCWVFFALDIGYAIDLDAAESLLSGPTLPTGAVGAVGSGGDVRRGESACPAALPHPGAGGGAPERAGQKGGRRVPASFRFRPPPLRIDQPAPEVVARG